MFGILLSAFYTILGFVLRSVLVKFVLYFALFFVTSEFIQLIVPSLPGASLLTSAFSAQAPGVWFFLDLFKIGFGVSAVLSASVTRFIIRRLPVIG